MAITQKFFFGAYNQELVNYMKKLMVLISLMLIMLASSVSAFPLSGGNGKANATVFGIIRGEVEGDEVPIYVDIGANLEDYTLVLVDDDDKFYAEKSSGDSATGGTNIKGVCSCGFGWWTGWAKGGFCRNIRYFVIPNKATIKRLRFEPKNLDRWLKPEEATPFSINWEGIPEVSDGKVLIKFYGAQKQGGAIGYPNAWNFELKITNNGTQNLIVKPSDFIIRDQYDWEYPGGKSSVYDEETQLLPGESMKFNLDVMRVSPLSRPVELRYGDLKMDISAWT